MRCISGVNHRTLTFLRARNRNRYGTARSAVITLTSDVGHHHASLVGGQRGTTSDADVADTPSKTLLPSRRRFSTNSKPKTGGFPLRSSSTWSVTATPNGTL
ncbi:MAG: hypothetical protein WC977_07910 [Anaerovoracaceae bacterium]